MTTIIRKTIKPAKATFINLLEYLKDLLSLLTVLFNVLLAKMKVEPIRTVAETFSTRKANMFVLTMPVRTGFNSTAPKYKTPMAVVMQSMEPNSTINRLGNTSVFNAYIEAFSFLPKTEFALNA